MRLASEVRRLRDRELLELASYRLAKSRCGLCRDYSPGPRCVACLFHGGAR